MRVRAFPLVLACIAAASVADAQVPGHPPFNRPIPLNVPGGPNGRPPVDDCAITSMNVFVQARRTTAMVDVGVRVHAVKGGACRIMPGAVQLSTNRGGAAARPVSVRFIDGQVQKPINTAEGAGGDQLAPWVGVLRANEERQVVLRYYVEGLDQGDGVIDPAGRVSVQLKNLGARVYAGAPLNVKVSVDPSFKARAQLSTGNPKTPSAIRPTGADGSASFSSALSKDDLTPQIEWRYDGDLPPVAESDKLANGLPVLEYLRSGLVQDFATALTTTAEKTDDKDKKDDKKKDDKKKDDKKDDKSAAAWDKAMDVSLAAARSSDPVAAAMGLRLFAWLASGLSVTATRVHAPGAAATPDSVEVPEKVAALVGKVSDGYLAATGQKAPPSVANSIFAKPAIAKLGEPGSRKKEAEEALKRLVARLDENKPGPTVGAFFSTAPAIALSPGVKTASAKLIAWNKQGSPYIVASGPAHTPKAPLVRRVIHAISHPKELAKAMLVLFVAGALITWAWLAMRPRVAEPVKA